MHFLQRAKLLVCNDFVLLVISAIGDFTTRYPHRSRHTRRSRSSGGNSVNMLPFYVPCAWRVTHSTTLAGGARLCR